jgi:hypothetical protein
MHVLLFHVVTCDLPTQLLHHDHPVVVTGSQDNSHIEGQFITYTCPTGFVLTGPNASACTGNGRWEPDPREVDCIGDYAHNRLSLSLSLSLSLRCIIQIRGLIGRG